MNKLAILAQVKNIYRQNGNIIEYLRSMDNRDSNTLEDILISYDLQAGSYTLAYQQDPSLRDRFSSHFAEVLNGLGEFDSLLEVGVGEATMLGITLPRLKYRPSYVYGFDISWSRIKFARAFMNKKGIDYAQLFVGDLFETPIKSDSIDVVYTVHAVEPNGGREREALKELYRITRKYLVLLEPSQEFASEEAKLRMDRLGYVKNLYFTAVELGYKVIEHRPFEANYHELNPVSVLIIEKETNTGTVDNPICCPITKASVQEKNGCLYASDSLLAYPLIDGIPCLLPQNAIVASKLLDDI